MPDDKPEPKLIYDPTTDPKYILRARKMDLDAGWLGRIVGSSKNAPNNIAFLVVALVVSAGLIVSFVFPNDRVEFWRTILPVITLTLGYLFGKGSSP